MSKLKIVPFRSQITKNDFSNKISFFATPKKQLIISDFFLIQIEAMDYIYYLYRPEIVLIEVLQKSSEREQVSEIAYINHVVTT
jgi:hypothetical protein